MKFMCAHVCVCNRSVFEHVFVVLGDDWGVSGLRGRLLVHIGQLDVHRCMPAFASLLVSVCAVCPAGTFQSSSGSTATACTGSLALYSLHFCRELD